MARSISQYDWTSTALGAMEHWPEALRSNLNLMLNSPFAMCMAWGPELTFFYNDAYIPVLGKRHGEALGRPIEKVWWDVWDAIGPWVAETMAGGTVYLHDTPLTMQRNGYAEDTWWTFAYSPLADGTGEIQGFIDVCIETTDKVVGERRLAQEQSRVRQLFDRAPNFMALLVGPDHRFELTNSGYQQLIGHRNVIGKTVAEMLGDAVAQGYLDLLDDVYATGKTYSGTNALYAVQAEPGGPVVDRYVDFVYQAMKDQDGTVYGIFVNGVDVTARVKADATRDVLNRELIHRIKNTLAITSAVVTASMRHASSLEEARGTISARIDALGRTQSLLTRPEGDVEVDKIITEALLPHLDSSTRVTLEGPSAMVSAQQAIGLSLAIYELATNAVKYGALSVSGGSVEVNWRTGADNSFEFEWRERDGPRVVQPTRSGFGSRLTNRIVASYFSGTGETIYEAEGVRFLLRGKFAVEAPEVAMDH